MNLKGISGLIIDIDGVIFEGDQAIGDLEVIFKQIEALNLAFVIATNNSSRSPECCVELFKRQGVTITADHVVNSVSVTLNYLQSNFPKNAALHVVGSSVLKEALVKAGYTLVKDLNRSVEAVIVGIDKELTYNTLKYASLHIQRGAAFIATNDDATVKSPDGLIPACGAIVKALETVTSVTATVMGKPYPPMYDLALKRLNKPRDQVVMIGDQLDTDIKGAQAFGICSALVLTGVNDRKAANEWPTEIDLIANDLKGVLEFIDGKGIA
jgi:4-nitrophenyl phosphatase